jgi:hypothetical protein
MRCTSTITTAFAVMVLLLTQTSCGSSQRTQPLNSDRGASSSARITNTDPCASQLHDIAGLLLAYYGLHHELPPTLGALSEVQTIYSSQFICPASRKPYIYNSQGIATENGLAIVYDAAPVHSGVRWAIAISEARGGALVAKVIALPESSAGPITSQPSPR